MAQGAQVQAVASLLQEWKRRSGRTYEGLARRSGLSRSSVHRYCQGLSLPESFGPLEALAAACGTEPAERAELFRVWSAARGWPAAGEEVVVPVEGAVTTERPAVEGPAAVEAPVPGRPPSRRWWWAVASAVTVTLVAVSVAGYRWVETTRDRPAASGSRQRVPGPSWTSAPTPISPAFFGVTLNSTTGAMPGFRVGAVRLWDSGTSWALLEPERGQFRWDTLDRLVSGAGRAGHPVLFTLGGTPGWASPGGPRTAYKDGSRSSAPDDLADWDAFVTALTGRYAHRIGAYELWVMAGSSLYWSGSPETLVAMTDRAARIIRAADPTVTVVCPSMGELWDPASRQFLQRFAALGGYQHCDVAGVKLHPQDFQRAPETILDLTAMIDRTFHEAGVSLPVWSTGTTYRIATADGLDELRARAYAVRLFLVTLYARYDRMYFYNWGGRKIPIVLQAEGGPPTTAARYVERLESWLLSARIYSCGHGPDDDLPDGVYRCRFRVGVPGTPQSDAELLWTSAGTARVPARADGVARQLDGGEEPLLRGHPVTVGEEPVFHVYAV